jgi:hypothetical protein
MRFATKRVADTLHTQIHACTHRDTHRHADTHTNTRAHTRAQTHAHTHMRTLVDSVQASRHAAAYSSRMHQSLDARFSLQVCMLTLLTDGVQASPTLLFFQKPMSFLKANMSNTVWSSDTTMVTACRRNVCDSDVILQS